MGLDDFKTFQVYSSFGDLIQMMTLMTDFKTFQVYSSYLKAL